MHRVIGLIERRYAWIMLLAAVATAAAVQAVRTLRIEHSQEKYSPPRDDPVVVSMESFRTRFGARTALVAALDFKRTIGVDDIRIIQLVEREIRSLPRVADVFGVADVRQVAWDLFQPHVMPVLGMDGVDEADYARLRRLVEDTPIYGRGLVSSDWRIAGLAVELERHEGLGRDAREARSALQVDSVLRAASDGRFDVYLTGMPLLNRALQDSTRSDVQLFGGLSVFFVIVFLLMLFRHWRPVVLACLVAAVSLVWTLGLLAATDTAMSASLAMVVPLILVISVAFSLHYLAHFYGGTHISDPHGRFEAMMQVVFPPSLLTGVTTSAGFLALATSRLEAVRETGLFIAAGVLLSLTASSVLLPALLRHPLFDAGKVGGIAVLPNRVASGLAGVVCRRAGLIIGATAVLITAAAVGAKNLRFDANPLHFFSPDTPLRRSSEIIDGRLGGSLPLEIVLERSEERLDGLVPAVLRVERQLREMPELGFVGSAIDFLQLAEAARPSTTPRLYDLATGRFPVGIWSRLAADRTMGGYVVRDSAKLLLRIACRVKIGDSEALQQLVARVEGVLADESLASEASVTGLVPLLLRTQQYMVDSQTSSLLIAFVLVLVLLFPFVRSWRVGVLAVAANVVPLIIIIGVMGWLDIPVDIASVMIASVALGIIVDDTIHFLYRFRIGRATGLAVGVAIERTYAVVGMPMVTTSLVLIGGFLVLIPSTFRPTSIFGLLSAITIAAAFVADLLLLPALLVVFPENSREVVPLPSPNTSDPTPVGARDRD